MIAWTLTTNYGGPKLKRFDARVGHLHVGCEDNGEGWFNWWVATAEQGVAPGEWMCLKTGGAKSEDEAKLQIHSAVIEIVMRMLEGL